MIEEICLKKVISNEGIMCESSCKTIYDLTQPFTSIMCIFKFAYIINAPDMGQFLMIGIGNIPNKISTSFLISSTKFSCDAL
jgi:hypothetical protein